mgnify:CR=1 FL=1|jgi:hypothetical protein|tara:strand:+ start:260 stop:472 length:213 start_codon:yes stop_codon:yes gene_type:complete
MNGVTIDELNIMYETTFKDWNKDFKIPKREPNELLMDIEQGNIQIPNERQDEVKTTLQKFILFWQIILAE